MSTCPDEELYCAFIDGEVSPLLKENLQAHLLECEKCKYLINKYKLIRFALIYSEVTDLDLNLSFKKLIAKRDSLEEKRYAIFPFNMKYKLFASIVASVFIFIFLFILLRNNSTYDKAYTLYEGEVKFTPIVPMSYRQHNNVLTNIDLRDLTSVIKTNKKHSRRIYTNLTDTFNNFSCLYTSLKNDTDNFTIAMPNTVEKITYNYGINMSIYVDLNKNAE